MLEDFFYSKEQEDFSLSKQLSPDLKCSYKYMRFECRQIEKYLEADSPSQLGELPVQTPQRHSQCLLWRWQVHFLLHLFKDRRKDVKHNLVVLLKLITSLL